MLPDFWNIFRQGETHLHWLRPPPLMSGGDTEAQACVFCLPVRQGRAVAEVWGLCGPLFPSGLQTSLFPKGQLSLAYEPGGTGVYPTWKCPAPVGLLFYYTPPQGLGRGRLRKQKLTMSISTSEVAKASVASDEGHADQDR